jgi:uncharacterized protein DUF2332
VRDARGWAEFRGWLLERRDEILAVLLARRTQTNEPARCATLLPLLATLPQPLALLEVGASAGLCLLADRYAYDFDGSRGAVTTRRWDPADVRVPCESVDGLDAVWVANEAPGLLTGAERPKHPWPSGSDPFLLTRDRQPVAWTDSHGTSIEWIA